jgi:predicted Rossmann fold nucleotide-binding protein DprA/Smf involved in DNA uptake
MANLKLPKKQQKTLWEIGADLRLVLTAMPKDTDDTADNLVKRNRMAASVSRYVRQATATVEAVGLGKFPTLLDV